MLSELTKQELQTEIKLLSTISDHNTIANLSRQVFQNQLNKLNETNPSLAISYKENTNMELLEQQAKHLYDLYKQDKLNNYSDY